MPNWTGASIPDLAGRLAVVTGASSGIGLEAAAVLAGKNAAVVLAVRDPDKGRITRDGILALHPRAEILIERADMADLASVRACAERLLRADRPIDILLNNAGLGLLPRRTQTVDGFETQLGTNHLGHFALTGLLLPALLAAPAPRVVTISSIAHRRGRIDFADLQAERSYGPSRVYAQSKLANLMFALALDRRLRAARSPLLSVAAHPGISFTNFFSGAGKLPFRISPSNGVSRTLGFDPARGALPGLYAATMPDVAGGQYWGPDGAAEIRGYPAPARISPHASDQPAQDRLWSVSEALTGVRYDLPG